MTLKITHNDSRKVDFQVPKLVHGLQNGHIKMGNILDQLGCLDNLALMLILRGK